MFKFSFELLSYLSLSWVKPKLEKVLADTVDYQSEQKFSEQRWHQNWIK